MLESRRRGQMQRELAKEVDEVVQCCLMSRILGVVPPLAGVGIGGHADGTL